MCVVLYSAYYGITLTLTRAHWVRSQLHTGQRPPWPDLSCLSLYKIFAGSDPTCYSCPGALCFYIFVKASAALPGMAIRWFRPWVSVSPLRHLPLGWVTRLMGTYSPQVLDQLFHPSVSSKLNEYHLFSVIFYCLFCLFCNHFF